LSRIKAEKYRREHPEEFEDDQEEHDTDIERYLRSQYEENQRRHAPPPHPAVQSKKEIPQQTKRPHPPSSPQKPLFQSSMEMYRQDSDLKGSAYEVERLNENTRAKNLLNSLSSPQDLILLREILGPPKSMQKSFDSPLASFDEIK
jgi:hypothetical protein